MKRRAFITGLTGQDGSYLAELLLSKGYDVHGLVRRTSSWTTARIDHLRREAGEAGPRLFRHYGDLTDASSLTSLLRSIQPDEIYNLGAQSHVKVSFENPLYTVDVDAFGALRLLEAVRILKRPVRLYQASSSDMYGTSPAPQSETTPFRPCSPYGCAKLFAYWQAVNYREAYGVHVCNGILFNHESPRRGENFVTRKITRGATRIKLGLQKKLVLGDLEARRDWGFAGDYVRAMWLMLQRRTPDDYVIATGEVHSVKEFCKAAFDLVGLDWRRHVESGAAYRRPRDPGMLRGDPRKARRLLKWKPTVGYRDLVRMMVESDLELARKERADGKA